MLLTGNTGQVGWRLERLLPEVGEVVAVGRRVLDLARIDTIRDVIRAARPDVIVNAAGCTHVDHVESDAQTAHAVNAVAPGVIAEEALRLGALFVHYSSGYVFDGTKTAAYAEADAPNPVNEYGRSKLRGEQAIAAVGGACLILRASWVYDTRARNFVLTMLRLAAAGNALDVVDDQIGSPTSARAIAQATCALLRDPDRARSNAGIYNLAATGAVSRYDFTREMIEMTSRLREGRAAPRLDRIRTADFPLPAVRPLNCVLDSTKLMNTFDVPLADWQSQLRECLAGLDPATVQPD